MRTIYVGTDPYTGVPFEQSVDYQDVPFRFYIDNANASYHLIGT